MQIYIKLKQKSKGTIVAMQLKNIYYINLDKKKQTLELGEEKEFSCWLFNVEDIEEFSMFKLGDN